MLTVMNILRRTPQPSLEFQCRAVALVVLLGAGHANAASAQLQCQFSVPGRVTLGQAVWLRLSLVNRSTDSLQVLKWGTPFEGWLAPFVSLKFEGRELDYQGPVVKRGGPSVADYLALAPQKKRSAKVNLAMVFDLTRAGRYELVPRMHLYDVKAVKPKDPVSVDSLIGQDVNCPSMAFEMVAPEKLPTR